jgi:predicted nuclease of predicted toxin-antitoxin system
MKLYLDQMFRVEFAEILQAEGHDVLRASEIGQAAADDAEILNKIIEIKRILIT